MSMTESEIREALARAERATPGPWTPGACVSGSGYSREIRQGPGAKIIGDIGSHFVRANGVDPMFVKSDAHHWADATVDFVCAARTDVPRLAADLLAARKERDEARAMLSKLVVEQAPGTPSPFLGHAALIPEEEERWDIFVYVLAQSDAEAGRKAARVSEAIEAGVRAETAEARCRELEAERDEARAAGWNANVEASREILARAEAAKARCRELEAEIERLRAERDVMYAATHRQGIEIGNLRALLSPPPSPECGGGK